MSVVSGVISRQLLPACGNLCFFCPAMRARSRQPVKRYKKLIQEIFPRSQEEEPNDRKIGKLCEYAAKNPLRIPKRWRRWRLDTVAVVGERDGEERREGIDGGRGRETMTWREGEGDGEEREGIDGGRGRDRDTERDGVGRDEGGDGWIVWRCGREKPGSGTTVHGDDRWWMWLGGKVLMVEEGERETVRQRGREMTEGKGERDRDTERDGVGRDGGGDGWIVWRCGREKPGSGTTVHGDDRWWMVGWEGIDGGRGRERDRETKRERDDGINGDGVGGSDWRE
ncbi:hypothetical protein U1Q18_051296, partial [Sarracenia purpurea var. burkii]